MKSLGGELKALGYHFNSEGNLVTIATGEPFTFVNQSHYDQVSLAVQDFIFDTLVSKYHCVPLFLPLPGNDFKKAVGFGPMLPPPSAPFTTVYMREDAPRNRDKLLLVIQGSGSVRPGQWSRSATINGSLEEGTIFPYLDWAVKEGYSYLILNPNNNKFTLPEGEVSIPGNDKPENHAIYCWENIVQALPAKHIDIVAHSYGGMCTLAMLQKLGSSFEKRVRRIAFTDAVHSVAYFPKANVKWLQEHAINWIESNMPRDTPAKKTQSGCPCVSSGHSKHEYTSHAAMPSVFKWLSSGVAPKF